MKLWALEPEGWRPGSPENEYDLNEVDECIHRESVFYKERWINEKNLEQRLVVTFSPRYKHCQRNIRSRQIERTEKMIDRGGSAADNRKPNSPIRSVTAIQMTVNGAIADKQTAFPDAEKITEEEKYEGFTAVCTALEDDVSTVLKITRRIWEIEEPFRLMKTEFRARPMYLQRENRIKAHFPTCFLALLLFRKLEEKLDGSYTASEIIETLRKMDFYKISEIGYIPCYKRTQITDASHDASGFRTDKGINYHGQKNEKNIRDTKK